MVKLKVDFAAIWVVGKMGHVSFPLSEMSFDNRQSSKCRECFQNRSSQSVSKNNKWDPIVVLSTDLDLIFVLEIHMFS